VTAGRSSRPVRLGRSFFDRPTAVVARELLGATLSVAGPAGRRSVRLVETEAYVGGDPANHAYRGPTPRNRSMFASPGTLYVYRIHQVVCANLVTRRGEAVLVRAGAPLSAGLRPSNGPGRLCRALGIVLADDGADAARGRRVSVWRTGRPVGRIVSGPRVGIRRAAARRLRFALANDPWVSRPAVGGGRRISAASPTRNRGAARSIRTRRRSRRPSAGGRSGGRSGGR
jgi:DNA-3-methyladenine glycosylase